MIRPYVLPCKPSVQIRRQVKSWLMEQFGWDRVPELDCCWEVWRQVCVSFGVGDLELVFVPLGAVASGLELTCSKVYNDKSIHDIVHHADLPGLQVFKLELSQQGRDAWGVAEVMRDVVSWSSLHHLQCGFQILLMRVPHHRCILSALVLWGLL